MGITMNDDFTPDTSTGAPPAPLPLRRPAPLTAAAAPQQGGPSGASAVAGAVVVALLCGVVLGLAFRSGAYSQADWLPFLIGVAALAILVTLSGLSLRTGLSQCILLAVFALLALWTALSLFWAVSLGDTWEEINRTAFYAVTIALVFAAVRWAGPLGLRVLTGLLVAVVAVVALVILVQLATNPDAISLFGGGRLKYPITYFNGLGCFLMIGFWLALGLANMADLRSDHRDATRSPGRVTAGAVSDFKTEATAGPGPSITAPRVLSSPRCLTSLHAPSGPLLRVAQPVLLMLAVFLLEFALLPQSRGTLWTFILVIPSFLVLSPNRLRALVNLVIVVVPLLLFWDRVNGVYAAIQGHALLLPAIISAVRGVGYSLAIVLVAWGVTYLVERLLGPLSPRPTVIVGTLVIVIALGCTVIGLFYADTRTGGLGHYLSDRWHEFASDTAGRTSASTRFTGFGLTGRLTQWKVAEKAFEEHPVLGIGAQNFELYNYRYRTVPMAVRNPHSQPMQFLAELGIPGLALYLIFTLGILARALVLRFRGGAGRNGPGVPPDRVSHREALSQPASRDRSRNAAQSPDAALLSRRSAGNRGDPAVIGAMMTAALSWFIHSSADWMWQLAAVTLPAMMLFAGLLAAGRPGWHRTQALSGTTAGPNRAAEPPGIIDQLGAPMPTIATTAVAPSAGDDNVQRAILGPTSLRRAEIRATQAKKRRLSHSRWVRHVARWVAVALAVATIASAAFPYLSLRYSSMASVSSDVTLVDSWSHLAAWLDPTAVHPFAARANAYTLAAGRSPEGSRERAIDLKLASDAWVDAARRFPEVWLNNYMAAQALLAARDAATAAGLSTDARVFVESAKLFLEEAGRLNPLSEQVTALRARL
jgi:O-antigen ligase